MIWEVSRHTEEQEVKDRFLRDTGENFKRLRRGYQKHWPEISSWINNSETSYIATGKPEGNKLEEAEKAEQGWKHCLHQNKWHQLVSENWLKGNKIGMSYHVGDDRFRNKKAVLIKRDF
jgi:hypothetical protein